MNSLHSFKGQFKKKDPFFFLIQFFLVFALQKQGAEKIE